MNEKVCCEVESHDSATLRRVAESCITERTTSASIQRQLHQRLAKFNFSISWKHSELYLGGRYAHNATLLAVNPVVAHLELNGTTLTIADLSNDEGAEKNEGVGCGYG